MRHFRVFNLFFVILLCTAFIFSSCKDDGGSNNTPTPEITGVSPTSGSIGDQVTITGTDFGSNAASNTVTFNGTEATLSSASASRLVTNIPSGATSGPVRVAVDGQTATGPNFTLTMEQTLSFTSDSTFSIEENSTAVSTVTVNSPSGDDITFSLSGGNDQSQFTINETSGGLSFSTAPDFEAPADANTDNVYQVQVSASDGSNSASQDINVTVTDVNENQAPTITSDESFNIQENSTAVATITATDPDGDDLTFSLSGGNDQSQFTINQSSGELSFSSAPDFEAPADGNSDNVYQVQVSVSDGSQSATQTVAVTVSDEAAGPIAFTGGNISVDDGQSFNASPPDFIFDAVPEGIDLASVSGGIMITAEATERNFSPSDLDVTISGPDASFIDEPVTIASVENAGLGQQVIDLRLSFNGESPDFENPADDGANNTYIVDITITDTRNGDSVTQRFTTPISDVDGE